MIEVRLTGMKDVNGFVWPEGDTECARLLFQQTGLISEVVSYCKERRSVVQAGGNCGVWPSHLSRLFDSVYTFEPDYENFRALSTNVGLQGLKNVFPFRAAVGEHNARRVSMKIVAPNNCGAHEVVSEKDSVIPSVSIDSLCLDDVDLIFLDVEGSEALAVLGATDTIRSCSPVIAFEDKGLGSARGWGRGSLATHIAETFKYAVVHKTNTDIVMVPL